MAELASRQVTYETSLVPEAIEVMTAFLGRNAMPRDEVTDTLKAVHATLLEIAGDAGVAAEHLVRLDAAAAPYLEAPRREATPAGPETTASALLSYLPPSEGNALAGWLARSPAPNARSRPPENPAPASAPVEAKAPSEAKAPVRAKEPVQARSEPQKPTVARTADPAPVGDPVQPPRKMRKRDRDRLAARLAREALQQKIPGLDVEARAPVEPSPAPALVEPAPEAKAPPPAQASSRAEAAPAPVREARARVERKPTPQPSVDVDPEKSVQMEWLVCLEDGKKTRDLASYVRSRFSMEPEEYRAKWGLPDAYPMVPPGLLLRKGDLFEFDPMTREMRSVAR